MKKLTILSTLCFLLFTLSVNAQIPPAAFSYSAVARDAQNNPIATTTIGIQISLLKTPETTEETTEETPEEIIEEIPEETDTIKQCFVYGSKVDDFHTLDKNYIFTLNVCATQELYKLIQQLQERISILEARAN